MGGEVVVRCREGHLFTTIWVPFASLKAIRLGWFRLQRCPVGNNSTFVTPVKDSDLTKEERLIAERYRDTPIPCNASVGMVDDHTTNCFRYAELTGWVWLSCSAVTSPPRRNPLRRRRR